MVEGALERSIRDLSVAFFQDDMMVGYGVIETLESRKAYFRHFSEKPKNGLTEKFITPQ